MAVLLPNTSLGVQRRVAEVLDAHGDLVSGGVGPLLGPWPGATTEQADGTWVLHLDPASWPLRLNDVIVEPSTGRTWVSSSTMNLRHALDDTVSYVRATAREVIAGGTEPGGSRFVGRS